ncbi:MAG: metalloregulator ArsR/SmtB family transcription factor [Saccharofermentans sp.]|nr:metalloregulator ArsR/SmtB family transcription factor [Saccharofermentans sp.]
MNDELFLKVLGILSESVRYKILSLIASRGEISAKEILSEFDFTQPTLSHHMTCLKEAGLVITERKGRYIYYSVNKDTIKDVIEGISLLKGDPVTSIKDADERSEIVKGAKKGKKKKKKDKTKKKKKD